MLADQGANRFRVQAYPQAAEVLRGLAKPVSEIFAGAGVAGLEKFPGVGESIARVIRDILRHRKVAMLDRLRGKHDPIVLLTSVPGIGKTLAGKLHDDLGLESLEALESAAHDGRLESVAGLGAKRLAGIRDACSAWLGARDVITRQTLVDDCDFALSQENLQCGVNVVNGLIWKRASNSRPTRKLVECLFSGEVAAAPWPWPGNWP